MESARGVTNCQIIIMVCYRGQIKNSTEAVDKWLGVGDCTTAIDLFLIYIGN